MEVLYTAIQSLTADGRDRGLDYKLSGFHVPPGSPDAEVGQAAYTSQRCFFMPSLLRHAPPNFRQAARCCSLGWTAMQAPLLPSPLLPSPHRAATPLAQMLPCCTPGPDEIVLPKTSSSVFQSTNLDYLLRSLGVRQLVLCGCVTGAHARWTGAVPAG